MNGDTIRPLVSVIMPTFNQAAFLPRAVESLKAQTFTNWELIVINDGSTDETEEVLSQVLSDVPFLYLKNKTNTGLGNALNWALDVAHGELIAYLPSDDIYFSDHLELLSKALNDFPLSAAAITGIRHNYNKKSLSKISGHSLQLVQMMHKKTSKRWITREELVTDDLGILFWHKLGPEEQFAATGRVTCNWVDHPHQQHKMIREPEGGINKYRSYYQVQYPLRFKSSVGNYIDEYERFKNYHHDYQKPSDGLTILLVGELAYNPERIMALEERGHRLVGLWTKDPYWFNYVGPLPFGHIQTISYENWKEEVKNLRPDIIYGLLNWQAVPFVHEILMSNTGIPFVWNFKEGPFISIEKGHWQMLVDLYTKSDGQIYTSPEMKDWFSAFLPQYDDSHTFLMDGDLPKKDWFQKERSQLLSERTGEIHTVVPGRPIGLHPHIVKELSDHKIHLHFYGDFNHGLWKEWISKTQDLAGRFIHIHPNVDQNNWVEEFSQFDAGWLHTFDSLNEGELRKANWDDLNYPARIATLTLSGLPLIQKDNEGHIVATQTLAKKFDIGIFYHDIKNLSEQLHDKKFMNRIRENVWEKRHLFTFDHHADDLISFFRKVIKRKKLPETLELITTLSEKLENNPQL